MLRLAAGLSAWKAAARAGAARRSVHGCLPAQAANKNDNIESPVAASRDLIEDDKDSKKTMIHNTLGVLSGTPEDHLSRHVMIFRPARSTTQQGRGTKLQKWHLKFVKKDAHSDRWTNPLMGWTSTADPLSNLDVSFATQKAAIEFAERNGFTYTVEDRPPEKENVRSFQAFGKSMVHQWRHNQIPVYEDDRS
mmetsp:Transcript_6001/g.18069  ORF Transcript_6001/g.18069 Transcript_6001/m.18069 type:complete len:193 (-) Transcript_6001:163-741(-)